MADVSALFAARKNKKKKKKTNAVSLLERERAYDMDMDGEGEFLDYEDDGGELTLPTADEDFGTWVEDEDEDSNPKSKFLLSGKKTKEVLDLQDLQLADKKEAPVVEDSETKREFHRARQQALAAAAVNAEPDKPKEPEKPVKQVYRPRQVLEAKAKVSGEAALKQMDNEEYFPSLGGPAKASNRASSSVSAWGKVDVKIESQQQIAPAEEEVEYLGANFIPAATYDKRRPGYVFASRELGTGYYWEGGDTEQDENTDQHTSHEISEIETTMPEVAGPQEVIPEVEQPTSNAGALEAAPEPIKSAIDEDEDEMLAELAKLKKKKKKKKKEDEAAES